MRHSLLVCSLLAVGCGHAPDGEHACAADASWVQAHEVFTQATRTPVDVLWVVDQSASMAGEQPRLAAAMQQFMGSFLDEHYDFHIGVVSTNPEDNGLLRSVGGDRFILPTTPNPTGQLIDRATTQLSASARSAGLLSASEALAPSSPEVVRANAGFLREDAALHIFFVSDSDDQSAPELTADAFVTFLAGLKPNAATLVTVTSIVGDTRVGCAGGEGATYLDVAQRVGGGSRALCADDWSLTIAELGWPGDRLRSEFYLTALPVQGSLDVRVYDGGTAYRGIDPAWNDPLSLSAEDGSATAFFSYHYDRFGNAVGLGEFLPSPGAQLHVWYDRLSAACGADRSGEPVDSGGL